MGASYTVVAAGVKKPDATAISVFGLSNGSWLKIGSAHDDLVMGPMLLKDEKLHVHIGLNGDLERVFDVQNGHLVDITPTPTPIPQSENGGDLDWSIPQVIPICIPGTMTCGIAPPKATTAEIENDFILEQSECYRTYNNGTYYGPQEDYQQFYAFGSRACGVAAGASGYLSNGDSTCKYALETAKLQIIGAYDARKIGDYNQVASYNEAAHNWLASIAYNKDCPPDVVHEAQSLMNN